MLTALPLTLVSLLAYNAVVFGLFGGDPLAAWQTQLFNAGLPSGAQFTATVGDGLEVAGVVLLFLEILKATRTGTASLVDHMLSTAVLVAYIVEFLTVGAAGHPVFALLAVLALVDVVAGFSVTIRGARRDVGWGS